MKLNHISYKDKLLYRLVCNFHKNKPVRACPPWVVLSSDDTTEYVTLSTQPEQSSKVGVVAKASLNAQGTRSILHVDHSRKMNGRRVKRHFISNGAGDCAPAVWCDIYIKQEMPMDGKHFIVWRVQGLCIGGYGINESKEPWFCSIFGSNKSSLWMLPTF